MKKEINILKKCRKCIFVGSGFKLPKLSLESCYISIGPSLLTNQRFCLNNIKVQIYSNYFNTRNSILVRVNYS